LITPTLGPASGRASTAKTAGARQPAARHRLANDRDPDHRRAADPRAGVHRRPPGPARPGTGSRACLGDRLTDVSGYSDPMRPGGEDDEDPPSTWVDPLRPLPEDAPPAGEPPARRLGRLAWVAEAGDSDGLPEGAADLDPASLAGLMVRRLGSWSEPAPEP
jgi:hypothetical protein